MSTAQVAPSLFEPIAGVVMCVDMCIDVATHLCVVRWTDLCTGICTYMCADMHMRAREDTNRPPACVQVRVWTCA